MKKLIAVATAFVAIIPFAASPATAQGGGSLKFKCTADLDFFPSPSASGSCKGSARVGGQSVGAGGGIVVEVGGTSYVVAGGATNNFNASFTYNEPCVAGEPPLTGNAEGTASITGLTARGSDGSTATASVNVSFRWVRVGAAASIEVTGGSITVGTQSAAVTGRGTAAFAPILTADNLCPEGGPLEAEVVGSATVTAL